MSAPERIRQNEIQSQSQTYETIYTAVVDCEQFPVQRVYRCQFKRLTFLRL